MAKRESCSRLHYGSQIVTLFLPNPERTTPSEQYWLGHMTWLGQWNLNRHDSVLFPCKGSRRYFKFPVALKSSCLLPEDHVSDWGFSFQPGIQTENKHLPVTSLYYMCYEPKPSICGITTSHVISDTFFPQLNNDSQDATFPTPISTSKLYDFFKVKCHIYIAVFI